MRGESAKKGERGDREKRGGRDIEREERGGTRTEEKGNGWIDEGRAARNCWAGGSGGSMCSVCPASACIRAKVEAGSALPCSSCPRFSLAGEIGPLAVGH